MTAGPFFARIPLSLIRHPHISDAGKLLYGVMLFHQGHNNSCRVKHETLAAEIAVTDRQLRRLLRELCSYALVEWDRTRGANRYSVRDLIAWECEHGETGQKCPIRSDKNVQSRPDKNVRQKRRIEKTSFNRRKQSLSVSGAESAPLFGGVLTFISETLNNPITDSAAKRLNQQLRDIPLTEDQMIDVLRGAVARAPKPPRTLAWFAGTLRKHLWDRQQQAFPPSVSRPANGWMDQDEVDRLAEAFGG